MLVSEGDAMKLVAVTCALCVVLASTPASAQDKRDSREREAQRRLQLQVQKLQQENARLQTENTDSKNKLGELEAKAAKVAPAEAAVRKTRGELAAQTEKLNAVNTEKEALEKKLAETQATVEVLTRKQAELDQALRAT